MYSVYILHSERVSEYYVGHTANLENRLAEHNRGKSKHSRKGLPWALVTRFECASRREATRLENRIKKRGIERFLSDMGSSNE